MIVVNKLKEIFTIAREKRMDALNQEIFMELILIITIVINVESHCTVTSLMKMEGYLM